jgi:hypothetical protein
MSWAISALTNNLASRALCVFALAREAQSNDVAISLPLFVRPAGVITPTTHHRLPSSKPSRHALLVRQPGFQPCLAGALSVSDQGATPKQEARMTDATHCWLRVMDV